MGQIADDMIDGTTCCVCGTFFVDQPPGEHRDDSKEVSLFTHGFPAACFSCWRGMSKRERNNHQRALRPTL